MTDQTDQTATLIDSGAQGSSAPDQGGAAGGSGQGSAPAATPETPTGQEATSASKSVESASTSDASTPEADWRAAFHGGDAKLEAKLARFTDPGALMKSFVEKERALHDSGRVRVPDHESSDEELRAWRDHMGIPEKPESYEIDYDQYGDTIDESDKAFLSEIHKDMHGNPILGTPQAAKYAVDMYAKVKSAQVQAMEEAAAKSHQEALDTLKKEWGGEFSAKLAFANAGVKEHFDVADPSDILQLRLADGSALGSNAAFVKAMASVGRLTADDPTMLKSLNLDNGTAASVDARIAEIMSLRDTDPAAYKRLEAPGGELEKLMTLKSRNDSRAA